MKQSEAFPSNFLKAEDFAEGEEKEVVISKIKLEEMTNRDGETEIKPTVEFTEGKGIVLNKTNWNRIVQVIGAEDSDFWVGKKIVLCTEMVEAFGEIKPAIRVKLVKANQDEITAFWAECKNRKITNDEGKKILKNAGNDFAKALADLKAPF